MHVACGEPDLLLEATLLLTRRRGREQFEGNGAIEQAIMCAIDGRGSSRRLAEVNGWPRAFRYRNSCIRYMAVPVRTRSVRNAARDTRLPSKSMNSAR